MPEILVRLAFGEYTGPYDVVNPCKAGMLWIRGIDINPVLVSKDDVQAKIAEYQQMLARLK
jgi:hypothetical protein